MEQGTEYCGKYYFAPLEGITGYIYRTTYEKYYGGIDAYFSPFVVTRDRGIMKKRELRDILPENNEGIPLIPQLLTNIPENFIQAANQMAELGYEEVNLNLGCPSGTVVSKGRGAGFLDSPVKLERFFEEIFNKTKCSVSVKTRIGVEEEDEFPAILEIYNKFPIRELTIHPRTRREFYKGKVHKAAFAYAMKHSKIPLCYNGDICSRQDAEKIAGEFNGISAIMAGRGLIARPGFLGNSSGKASCMDKKVLRSFTEELFERYREVMSGDIHALHKMKEVWIYMAPAFTNYEKYLKKIKKTDKTGEYIAVVGQLFAEEDLL